MGGRVIVVGSVNVDLVVTVERLPGPGETVTGGHFERHHGGKGGNAAVAAARLGASRSRSSARSAATRFGDGGARGPRGRGDRPRQASSRSDEPTGVALILVDRDGENGIAVAGGANAALMSVEVRARPQATGDRPGRRGARRPRDPDRRHARGAPPRSPGGGDDDPEPGAGERPRAADASTSPTS